MGGPRTTSLHRSSRRDRRLASERGGHGAGARAEDRQACFRSGMVGRLLRAALPRSSGGPPPRNHLPHFTAEMWVNQDSWRTLAVGPSVDHVFSYEYWIRGRTLYLGTAWFFGVPGLGGSSAGWTTAGTFQCEPGAWPVRYRWSNQRGPVTGRFNGVNTYAHYVVLTAEKDSCAERRHLLEGTWYSLGA